jgi:hypothetical protein
MDWCGSRIFTPLFVSCRVLGSSSNLPKRTVFSAGESIILLSDPERIESSIIATTRENFLQAVARGGTIHLAGIAPKSGGEGNSLHFGRP